MATDWSGDDWGDNNVRGNVRKKTDEDETELSIGRIGTKPCLSVDFYTGTGGVSFAYAHLYKIEFTGEERLVVVFSEDKVTITGWGLGKLRRYLGDHKAREVRVGTPNQARFQADDMGIESIVVGPAE